VTLFDFSSSTSKIDLTGAMRVRVDQIKDEESHCSFQQPLEGINERLLHGEVRDFRLTSPLGVDATYYRAGDDLFFAGRIHADLEGTCARCLEPFAFRVDESAQFVLVPTPKEGPERQLSEDDLSLSFYSGEEIDLAPLFTEQVILTLPTRALCSEDCRGLCPHCGVDLNNETCECVEREPDPRLAVLRNLRVERSS
jgi:uncharacterized protein